VPASVLTLILAGGEGERLSVLSQVRAKPGVPFGGKYRIIDFALSNAVNSGLSDVGILTQYAPRSLIDHIGVGRPWDLDRSRGGVSLLQPYLGRGRPRDWYRGTADAVLQNLDFVADRDPELVLVLAGDHVYKMDYRLFIEQHRATGAEVTCAVRTVPIEDARRGFEELYARRYGQASPSEKVEATTWRLTAIGERTPVELPRFAARVEATARTRSAYFPECSGYVEVPVHTRDELSPGQALEGPVIVEEKDSTTVLPPGLKAVVDEYGSLLAS